MGSLANDMVTGRSCSECGIYFEKEHGYPILCIDCFDADEWEEGVDGKLPKATITEL
jgi:hypothetical protein